MRSLEQAVALIGRWTPEKAKDRELVLKRIGELSTTCSEAIGIWQRYLDNPGPAGDKWTIMSWVGPTNAKTLHEINLKASDLLRAACAIAGPEAERIHAYEDSVIEMAYRQLNPGETGPDFARAAIERMRARRAYLDDVMARIGSIKFSPRKAAPKGAASPKKAAKKSPAKKVKAPPKTKAAAKKKAPVRGAKKTKKKAAPAKKAARKAGARRR